VFNLTPQGWRQLTLRWALFFPGDGDPQRNIWRTRHRFWVGVSGVRRGPADDGFAIRQMPLNQALSSGTGIAQASEADAGM